MPVARFQMPDGRVARFEVPEGTTPEQAQSMMEAHFAPPKQNTPEKPSFQKLTQEAFNPAMGYSGGNYLGGFLAGAGSYLPKGMEQRYEEAAKNVLGADPSSLQYKGAKLGGQVALTAGVGPALGAVSKALGAAPGVVNAFRTSGLSTGNAPTGLMAKAGDLALRTGAGATVGGASAGLVGESPTTGAMIGGALPGTLQAVGSVAKPIGRAFSNKLAEGGAVRQISEAMQPGDIAKLQQGDIPLSAAALTQNPALARVEQASRLKAPETWYGFDKSQGEAVFNKMMQATNEAADISQRAIKRQTNWNANWADVEKSVKPEVFNQKVPEFAQNIERALMSPESVNPSVRGFLESIKADIARYGDQFSPAHLQQIRANLSGRYNPMSPNAFASAPRDSKAVKSVLQEVDNILNESTGGVWAKVPAGYKADSQALHQAKAASKIRGSFVDESTGRAIGRVVDPLGDTPRITEAGLSRSMNAARMPVTKELALAPQANDELTSILQALRKQNIVQDVKRASTAGGGSDTASNMTALMSPGASKSILRDVLLGLRDMGAKKQNERLAELLSNPQQLQMLLQNQSPSNQALTQLLMRGAPVIPAQ